MLTRKQILLLDLLVSARDDSFQLSDLLNRLVLNRKAEFRLMMPAKKKSMPKGRAKTSSKKKSAKKSSSGARRRAQTKRSPAKKETGPQSADTSSPVTNSEHHTDSPSEPIPTTTGGNTNTVESPAPISER